MTLKQHALLALSLFSSAGLYAIPIESRGLSQTNPSSAQSSIQNPNSSMENSSPISGNPSWDLLQKAQNLENQIRELRGKIEEQDHQIDQLTKELNSRYADLDQRLTLLQSSDQPDEQDNQPDATPNPAPTANTNNTAANTIVPAPAPVPANQQELEKAAYTVALDAYKQGGAKKAIAPMQNFIKSYPDSVYTGNAYFWLAEFNLAIEPPNYKEAKKNYEVVASKFPNSAKASRALYQLYSIANDVEKNQATAKVYKNKLLSAYPKSEEAKYFK
ncbi:YbgF trimerization domain-containing protein [Acinetobacter rudis]|uniref:YbgF trimerization domain-containing protein n=1 Tax=Acinetobacter rudis TaxID=632955 RepID=UPI003341A02A